MAPLGVKNRHNIHRHEITGGTLEIRGTMLGTTTDSVVCYTKKELQVGTINQLKSSSNRFLRCNKSFIRSFIQDFWFHSFSSMKKKDLEIVLLVWQLKQKRDWKQNLQIWWFLLLL